MLRPDGVAEWVDVKGSSTPALQVATKREEYEKHFAQAALPGELRVALPGKTVWCVVMRWGAVVFVQRAACDPRQERAFVEAEAVISCPSVEWAQRLVSAELATKAYARAGDPFFRHGLGHELMRDVPSDDPRTGAVLVRKYTRGSELGYDQDSVSLGVHGSSLVSCGTQPEVEQVTFIHEHRLAASRRHEGHGEQKRVNPPELLTRCPSHAEAVAAFSARELELLKSGYSLRRLVAIPVEPGHELAALLPSKAKSTKRKPPKEKAAPAPAEATDVDAVLKKGAVRRGSALTKCSVKKGAELGALAQSDVWTTVEELDAGECPALILSPRLVALRVLRQAIPLSTPFATWPRRPTLEVLEVKLTGEYYVQQLEKAKREVVADACLEDLFSSQAFPGLTHLDLEPGAWVDLGRLRWASHLATPLARQLRLLTVRLSTSGTFRDWTPALRALLEAGASPLELVIDEGVHARSYRFERAAGVTAVTLKRTTLGPRQAAELVSTCTALDAFTKVGAITLEVREETAEGLAALTRAGLTASSKRR